MFKRKIKCLEPIVSGTIKLFLPVLCIAIVMSQVAFAETTETHITGATATASSWVAPYSADRAIDNSNAADSRWYSGTAGNKWLQLDLNGTYYIGKWEVYGLGMAGWDNTCNLSDYSLQGSNNGTSWTTLDMVTGNIANSTTRTISPGSYRYVRLYITKGNQSNNNWASVLEFKVYGVSPVVTSVGVPAAKNYLTGDTMNFTVNFTTNVTVNTGAGTPYLPITLDSETVNAQYVSGSGTSSLVFQYTVASGNNDITGIECGTSVIRNGGTINDALGNDANLTLQGVGSTADIFVNVPVFYTISVDTLTGGSIDPSVSTATAGTTVTLNITPESGMRIKAGTLKYNDGSSDISITGNSFTMPSANVTITAEFESIPPTEYTVTFNKNGGTTAANPTEKTTTTGATVSLPTPPTRSGYTFTGWNTAANGSGTGYSGGDTFAMGSSNVTLYAQWVANGGSGSSGGSAGSGSTTQPSQNTVVVVNGKEENAGKETQKTEDGKSTVTVAVDSKAAESKIDEAIKNNSTGIGNVIQVPVANTKSEVAKVELTGDIVKKLEQNAFDLSVKRDNVEYVIPAAEFTISKVAENLGLQEKDLADINVEVKITKLDEKVVEKYNEVAKTNGAELVFPPVQFEIVAKTTNTDGTTQEQSINKFSNYVERVMEIPSGVNPSKVTTGVVFNADGTYSHVPTEVYQKNGKWYARLNSMTNSDYSVIWNPVTVKSVEHHWAKDAVNDMASRLVVFNAESFEPDKAITRADFAEYIVRALGLYREGSKHENNFKDVTATGARTLGILIANEYGIVSGYSDGTFRGDKLITREEAMAMYQRAMKITNLVGNDENRYQTYTDFAQVADWAKTNVKNVLSAHVFNGTTAVTISPKANLTYAEAAQAIRNLLVESQLINK